MCTYRSDNEGRLVRASRSWATLFGYDNISECIGKSIADDFYVNPPDRKQLLEEIRQKGKVTGYQVLLRKKDGTPVLVEASSHLYFDPAGKIIGIEGTFRDITERKRAEEELRNAYEQITVNEEKFRELADLLPQGIYEADATGRMPYVNRLALEMSGYTREDIEKGLNALSVIAPEDRQRAATVFRQMVETGSRLQGEVEYMGQKKDGSTFPVSIYSSPISREGSITGIRGIIIDITERKKSEDELRAANEQLVASDEELRAQYEEIAQSEKRIRLSETRLTFMLGFYDYAQKSEKELLAYAIEGAGIVTGSALGYLAFLNDDESELSMYAWSKSAMAECSMREKPIVYKTEKTGLWGEAVRQRCAVITNDYAAPNPAKKGYPEGHPHIYRHMNVPVIEDGHIVLVAGVANKPSDYSENDANELLLLMQGLWTILKQKRAEEIKKKNEEELHLLKISTDRSSDQVFWLDFSGRFLYVNDTTCRDYGYSREEFSSMKIFDLNPYLTAEIWGMSVAGLREQKNQFITTRHRRRDGSMMDVEIVAVYVNQDDREYSFAYVRDITSRKKAEEEFRMVKISVDQSSDEVFWMDFDGNILYVNDAACRITGYSRDELVTMKIFDLDPDFPPEVWDASVDDLRKKKTQHIITRHRRRDGVIIDVEIIAVYVDQDGKEYSFAFVRDITDRKRTEEALFNSQQMLQAVLDSIPQRVFWKDRNSVYLGCNLPLARDAGFTDPADLIGKDDYSTASRATADLYRADDRRVMDTGESRLNYEEPQIRPDGSPAWLRTTKVPLRNKEGAIIGVLGTYEDITERKRAEEALRESEEKYRTLVESSFDGIAIHQDGILVYVNRTAARLLGSGDPGVFIGKPAIEIVVPAFREQITQRVQQAAESTQELIHEQFLRLDGTAIDVDVTTTPCTWNGKTAAYVTFRDISAQKQAADALRESEDKYRTLVETTSDFIWEVDAAGTYTYISPQVRRILGYEPEEMLRKTPFDIMPPAEAERVAGEFARCVESRLPIVALENKAVRKDGEVVILETSGMVRTATDGSYQGYRGIDRDITARKRAEEALREMTEELNQYFTASLDLFCIADTGGYFRRLNPEWEKTLGYTLAELESHRFIDFVHPDDLPSTLAAVADLGSQKEGVNFTNRYRHKNGKYRWIEWRSFPKGNLIFAAARDITARHDAAERTVRISALKRDLLRNAPLEEKLKRITDGIVDIFGADFARIWINGPGDLCDRGCIHAAVTEGPHTCRDRTSCLHLIVSSGRYTSTDGNHRQGSVRGIQDREDSDRR